MRVELSFAMAAGLALGGCQAPPVEDEKPAEETDLLEDPAPTPTESFGFSFSMTWRG